MNTPPPAATAAPLHLYDYTHGQRRLTVWREPALNGQLATYATVHVCVTEQAPSQAPQHHWATVATASAWLPTLLCHRGLAPGADYPTTQYRLAMGGTTFDLLQPEVQPLADYLGLDADALLASPDASA